MKMSLYFKFESRTFEVCLCCPVEKAAKRVWMD